MYVMINELKLLFLFTAESNVFVYYLQKGFGFTIEEVGVYNSYRQMIGAVSK